MTDEARNRWNTAEEMIRLRQDVDGLRLYRAGREVYDENLTNDVLALTTAVNALQRTIDTSKGALWVIGSLAGGIGAIAGAIATLLTHSGPK